MKSTYLVVYRSGPAWIPGKPVAEQPLKEHGSYMLSLYANGVLKYAGPFFDDAAGVATFEAEDDGGAKAVVAGNSAVLWRVFVAELHAWGLVDWEQHIR